MISQLQFRFAVTIKLAVAFLLLSAFTVTKAGVPAGIEVSIDALQSKYSVQEKILVEISYQNITDAPIQMLKHGTALEGRINEDFLSIVFDGYELPYAGRHYKRAVVTPLDYVTIPAGKKIAATVDILSAYDVDYKGEYVVVMRENSTVGPIARKQLLALSLTGDRPVTFKRTPVVRSCSSGRDSLIDSALSAAESLARRARDDLKNTPLDQRTNARRYSQWFGVYSESRWNTVQDHFNRIASSVGGRTITFVCDDDESAFAYVFADRPYDIYLGRAFWSAPRTGTDSKAGTIIHELSHFNILGGTRDLAYGQSAARALAINNPGGAIRNADSHEYFSENTPNLPMPSPGSAPVAASDLAITSISVANPNPAVRDVISISAIVENLGNTASFSSQISVKLSSDAQISINDPQITQSSIPVLDTGLVYNFQSDVQAPNEAGQYWIGVCVSAASGELITSNNCSTGIPLIVRRRAIITPILMLLNDDLSD